MTYTLGANGYVAVCLPFVWQVPEDCTAFIATEIASPSLILTPIAQAGEYVPYGTPVIVKGTARATITLKGEPISQLANFTNSQAGTNLLLGTYPGKTLAANEGYYLKTSGVNIYRATAAVTLPPFSCYMPSNEKRTYFKLEETTGIDSQFMEALAPERGFDAQNTILYNLVGQKIVNGKLPRGIYIQNGKKVFK